MTPTFFKNQYEFREWLNKNHKDKTELIVGFYKINSNKESLTWPQSVDQALCYGWIDGIRRSIDQDSYCIRFTPRRPTSIWSAINIAKVEQMTAQGLMQPAGIEAFKKRKEEKSKVYSFENDTKKLSDNLEMKFKANKVAWDFFTNQTPSYQKMIIHWVMTAKQDKTKQSRLDTIISKSEKLERI